LVIKKKFFCNLFNNAVGKTDYFDYLRSSVSYEIELNINNKIEQTKRQKNIFLVSVNTTTFHCILSW